MQPLDSSSKKSKRLSRAFKGFKAAIKGSSSKTSDATEKETAAAPENSPAREDLPTVNHISALESKPAREWTFTWDDIHASENVGPSAPPEYYSRQGDVHVKAPSAPVYAEPDLTWRDDARTEANISTEPASTVPKDRKRRGRKGKSTIQGPESPNGTGPQASSSAPGNSETGTSWRDHLQQDETKATTNASTEALYSPPQEGEPDKEKDGGATNDKRDAGSSTTKGGEGKGKSAANNNGDNDKSSLDNKGASATKHTGEKSDPSSRDNKPRDGQRPGPGAPTHTDSQGRTSYLSPPSSGYTTPGYEWASRSNGYNWSDRAYYYGEDNPTMGEAYNRTLGIRERQLDELPNKVQKIHEEALKVQEDAGKIGYAYRAG